MSRSVSSKLSSEGFSVQLCLKRMHCTVLVLKKTQIHHIALSQGNNPTHCTELLVDNGLIQTPKDREIHWPWWPGSYPVHYIVGGHYSHTNSKGQGYHWPWWPGSDPAGGSTWGGMRFPRSAPCLHPAVWGPSAASDAATAPSRTSQVCNKGTPC